MKVLENDETTCAEHAFAAHADADEQTKKNWPTFSGVKKVQALKLKTLCYNAYFGSRVYLNARKQFITVKVEKPSPSAPRLHPTEMALLHSFTVTLGIEPVASRTSLLFRIPK